LPLRVVFLQLLLSHLEKSCLPETIAMKRSSCNS
jgi:hypothetical protein